MIKGILVKGVLCYSELEDRFKNLTVKAEEENDANAQMNCYGLSEYGSFSVCI